VKIAFLTTDDPLYLPLFFERVLSLRSAESAVFVVPPLYRNQTPIGAARRYLQTFGFRAAVGLTAVGHVQGLATDEVPVFGYELVKGLELDAAVVVEPAAIVDEEAQGMRALYVALTRATKRLAVVHAEPLPEALTPSG